MKVRWEDLERTPTYERMVAVLLSRVHPESQRLDGSGGDEGLDVILRDKRGLRAFELKSFTGRLTGKRRTQVKRSLKRAARHAPLRWTLIVPIDPTPEELSWFEGLRADYKFPLVWRGRTWLDNRMSAHREIHRYFVQGAAEEVTDLLRQLQQEKARPDSAAAAVDRARALRDRLNDIDPHYSYDLVVGRAAAATKPPEGAIFSANFGDARVDLHPRYLGATRDRPITLTLELRFGPEDQALDDAVTRTIDYGAPLKLGSPTLHRVAIDAPAGLGGEHSGGIVEITPRAPKIDPIHIDAEISSEGRTIASLPLVMKPLHAGRRGGVLQGTDPSGWLEMSLTIDTEQRRFTLSSRAAQRPCLPGAALPALRWLHRLRSPHEFWMRSKLWSLDRPVKLTNDPLVEDWFLEVVEALDELQRASDVYFDLPVDLTPVEVRRTLTARRLLTGERVDGAWSEKTPVEVTFKKGAKPDLGRALSPEGAAMVIEADETIDLRGHKIPIGRVRTTYKSARVADTEDAIRGMTSRQAYTLKLVPGADPRIARQRITVAIVPPMQPAAAAARPEQRAKRRGSAKR